MIFLFFIEKTAPKWYNTDILIVRGEKRRKKMESPTLEYIIMQKNEGTVIAKKVSLILGIILLFSILGAVIVNLSAPLLYIPFFLLDAAFCAMVLFVTWRFLCIEYEIVMGGGEITLTVIYGKGLRRRLTSIPTSSLYEVGLYDDAAYEKLCASSLQKNYVCVSSLSAPVIYYALFDEGKDRCVLYFEADERAIKYLRQQNSSALRAGNIK